MDHVNQGVHLVSRQWVKEPKEKEKPAPKRVRRKDGERRPALTGPGKREDASFAASLKSLHD